MLFSDPPKAGLQPASTPTDPVVTTATGSLLDAAFTPNPALIPSGPDPLPAADLFDATFGSGFLGPPATTVNL